MGELDRTNDFAIDDSTRLLMDMFSYTETALSMSTRLLMVSKLDSEEGFSVYSDFMAGAYRWFLEVTSTSNISPEQKILFMAWLKGSGFENSLRSANLRRANKYISAFHNDRGGGASLLVPLSPSLVFTAGYNAAAECVNENAAIPNPLKPEEKIPVSNALLLIMDNPSVVK